MIKLKKIIQYALLGLFLSLGLMPAAAHASVLSLTFLTSPTGSNQTWTSPVDWNNASNTVETIGGGGSGGLNRGVAHSTGGGGGAWNRTIQISFATPGVTTATYQIGAGGVAVTGTAATAGNAGSDTWFNGATLAASSVGSKAGGGGVAGSGTNAGGTGGVGASGIGSPSNNGGNGGQASGSINAVGTGGGGAGGSAGAGNQGVDRSATGDSAGGSGDAGLGGAAGNGGPLSKPGGYGTEWDSTHGSGGGGGSKQSGADNTTGMLGGNYGGGGGSTVAGPSSTGTSGAGADGIIFISYQPLAGSGTRHMRVYKTFKIYGGKVKLY